MSRTYIDVSLHLSPCSCLVLAYSFMESTESMLRKWRLIKIHLHSLRLHCNGVRTVSWITSSLQRSSPWYRVSFCSILISHILHLVDNLLTTRFISSARRREKTYLCKICASKFSFNLTQYVSDIWSVMCAYDGWMDGWMDGHVPCI